MYQSRSFTDIVIAAAVRRSACWSSPAGAWAVSAMAVTVANTLPDFEMLVTRVLSCSTDAVRPKSSSSAPTPALTPAT